MCNENECCHCDSKHGFVVHRALLQRMAPEHKFATAAKLCGEVLGGVADGLLPLHQCEEVLGDALRCLASKDIKVQFRDPCGNHVAPHDQEHQ